MQKLKNNRGSVLVGVVAFTAILAIVVLSTIGLVRNMQNNEDAAFNEAKLSGAVESGLILGAALVNKQNSYATANNNLFASAPVSVNGITVTVRSAPSGTDTALITATAAKVGGAYSKTISMRLVKGAGSVSNNIFSTHAMYAGDNIAIQGGNNDPSVTAQNKYVYGKSGISITGNPPISALKWVSEGTVSSNKLGASVKESFTTNKIGFPNIDLTSMISGATTIASLASLPIPGTTSSVYYIDADVVNISAASFMFAGTLIVRGTVNISAGSFSLGSGQGKFGLISVNGDINVTANGNNNGPARVINGAVYAKNGSFNAGPIQVNGQIFVKNNMTFTNHTSFTYAAMNQSVINGITLVGSTGTPSIVTNSWNEANN